MAPVCLDSFMIDGVRANTQMHAASELDPDRCPVQLPLRACRAPAVPTDVHVSLAARIRYTWGTLGSAAVTLVSPSRAVHSSACHGHCCACCLQQCVICS